MSPREGFGIVVRAVGLGLILHGGARARGRDARPGEASGHGQRRPSSLTRSRGDPRPHPGGRAGDRPPPRRSPPALRLRTAPGLPSRSVRAIHQRVCR